MSSGVTGIEIASYVPIDSQMSPSELRGKVLAIESEFNFIATPLSAIQSSTETGKLNEKAKDLLRQIEDCEAIYKQMAENNSRFFFDSSNPVTGADVLIPRVKGDIEHFIKKLNASPEELAEMRASSRGKRCCIVVIVIVILAIIALPAIIKYT